MENKNDEILIYETLMMLRDDRFISLRAEHDKKNLFEIMGITHRENVHSAFLASLLAGDMGLDEFPAECLYMLYHKVKGDIPLYSKTGMFKIKTEKYMNGRVDIFGINEEHKIVFVIENKLKSKEHDEQTKKYYLSLENNYPEYEKICLFLTISGEEAEEEGFMAISYQDLFDSVLKPCYEHPDMTSEYKVILSHYINNLTAPISTDDCLSPIALVHKKECESIYSDYKEALQKVYYVNDKPEQEDEDNEEVFLRKVYKSYRSTFDEIFLSLDEFGTTPCDTISYKKGEQFQLLVKQGVLREGDIVEATYNGLNVKGEICLHNGKYRIKVFDDNGKDYLKINNDIVGGSPSQAIKEYVFVKTGKEISDNGMTRWKKNGKTLKDLCERL
ncbi:MAG: PD-(D/E)XK nuclease family protein [Lachnospiraceae bacterium]|nr:PD-(D/E)XK nuclease family protein [Lachnospiraceae bacterium]